MDIDSVFGLKDTGKQRERNEDDFGVFTERKIFVVADGMGGYAAGNVASSTVVRVLDEYCTSERITSMIDNIALCPEFMRGAIMYAHQGLLDMVEQKESNGIVGSTVALVFINKGLLHTCHVGDSRVYVLNSSGITQITEDHSNIANLIKEGAITKEEARMSPIKNQVTQALGSPYGIHPEYCEQPIGSGDLVLLCTDGLWDMLTDEEILLFCDKKSNMEDKCRYLIKMANKAGGEDNISVILIKVGQ